MCLTITHVCPRFLIVVCNEKYQKVMLNLMRIKFEIEECPIIRPFGAICSIVHLCMMQVL